ncbi:DUF6153 family protein [Arthrobacter sp. StoSoilA2]|uniref:DUF6153 family protein n=1 Tax=Arthrobacter sp. StoSoilA2 TaxID=2830990 RepID=UPI001CC5FF2F|nr:DUF6153 family protein [Arthrobacter sp. StoSoilA2]
MEPRPTITRFFLRAGLLAAVLALIAGLLGMHIMVGPHSLHTAVITTAADTSATAVPAPGDAATHTGHAGASQSVSGDTGMAPLAHCSCSGNCSSAHVAGGSCIPSVGPGGLAAPVRDSTTTAPSTFQVQADPSGTLWSYQPGSPSPGELSISRT